MATALATLRATPARRPTLAVEPASRMAGIAAAIGFHLILIAALLTYAPARRTIGAVTPLIVSLIAPEVKPAPPKSPPPPPSKPKPQPTPAPVERIVAPTPIASEAPAPSPITLPPPAPTPPPPVAQAVYAPEPAPAAPAPIIPPRFNADYLQNPPPPYPALARRMREQGRVLVRVLVGTDGAPERIELKTSSGSTRLDQSALETIRSWKFVPARQGGENVAAWVVVPITFTLES